MGHWSSPCGFSESSKRDKWTNQNYASNGIACNDSLKKRDVPAGPTVTPTTTANTNKREGEQQPWRGRTNTTPKPNLIPRSYSKTL
jgi:hypothetical protein